MSVSWLLLLLGALAYNGNCKPMKENILPHSRDYYAGYIKAITDNFDQLFVNERKARSTIEDDKVQDEALTANKRDLGSEEDIKRSTTNPKIDAKIEEVEKNEETDKKEEPEKEMEETDDTNAERRSSTPAEEVEETPTKRDEPASVIKVAGNTMNAARPGPEATAAQEGAPLANEQTAGASETPISDPDSANNSEQEEPSVERNELPESEDKPASEDNENNNDDDMRRDDIFENEDRRMIFGGPGFGRGAGFAGPNGFYRGDYGPGNFGAGNLYNNPTFGPGVGPIGGGLRPVVGGLAGYGGYGPGINGPFDPCAPGGAGFGRSICSGPFNGIGNIYDASTVPSTLAPGIGAYPNGPGYGPRVAYPNAPGYAPRVPYGPGFRSGPVPLRGDGYGLPSFQPMGGIPFGAGVPPMTIGDTRSNIKGVQGDKRFLYGGKNSDGTGDGHHLHRLLVLPGDCHGDHCTTDFAIGNGNWGGDGYGAGYGAGFGGYGVGFGGYAGRVGYGGFGGRGYGYAGRLGGYGDGCGCGCGCGHGSGCGLGDCGHGCDQLGFGAAFGGRGGCGCGCNVHDIHHEPIGNAEHYSPESPCQIYPHVNHVSYGHGPCKCHHPVVTHPTWQETHHHNIHTTCCGCGCGCNGYRGHGTDHEIIVLPHYGHNLGQHGGWNPYWGH